MKAILISVNPRYARDILKGIKHIEIRKSMPKCDLPIDVYIYCTKTNYHGYLSNRYAGKIVAKFKLNKVDPFYDFDDELCYRACLTREEMLGYLGDKTGYAWHIENLEIFNKPKEISEFKSKLHIKGGCKNCPQYTGFSMPYCATCDFLLPLNRAPQSYCYIEV